MMNGDAGNDTIVAIATPPGKGGIGIVRLSGPAARHIAETITGKTLTPRQAMFCSFQDDQAEIIDEGIVLYFKKPGSFTGEDVVELHTHGSPVVLQALTRRSQNLGARQARPGEFTERAFLSGKIDLLQAEAIADIVESSSLQAVKSASLSLQGKFSEDVDQVLSSIISLRTLIEGALDFPEEEIDFLAEGNVEKDLHGCIKLIDALLERSRQGRRLRGGKRIVIAGRPNVGKSSLMNRLSGYDTAIVSDISGTTRDLIEQEMMFSGIAANVIDTAGLRTAAEPVEKEGVARARQAIASADIVIYVREYVTGESDTDDLSDLPDDVNIIQVVNKIDLYQREPECREGPPPEIYLSAKTGTGLDLLVEKITRQINSTEASENVILARERHIDAMNRARQHLLDGLTQLQGGGGAAGELLAEDLRRAQESLSGLKGEFLADDLLGEIFSRFCIGK